MIKKLFVISTFLVLFCVSCVHNPTKNSPRNSIEGVWSRVPDTMERGLSVFYELDLSWGKKGFPRLIDIVVDLHSVPPIFEIPELTRDEIISVNEKGDKTLLTFYFARGEFNVTVIFHFNKDGTMWIESFEGGFDPGGTGRDFIYYKIDGP